MSAWGGYRNGEIPATRLEHVGPGAISGEPQYLHPAAAAAWRDLVDAVLERGGRRLTLVEGYRNRPLQEHYWRTLRPGAAALPGQSTHGWGVAIDFGNYQGSDLTLVREVAPELGWSLETGRIWNEPWHLEYTGPLTSWAGLPSTTIPEEEEDDMPAPRYRQVYYTRAPEPPMRALYSFDTGLFHQWTARTATQANVYAKDYDTGNAQPVTPSMFNEIRRACQAVAATPPSALVVTIAEAD